MRKTSGQKNANITTCLAKSANVKMDTNQIYALYIYVFILEADTLDDI